MSEEEEVSGSGSEEESEECEPLNLLEWFEHMTIGDLLEDTLIQKAIVVDSNENAWSVLEKMAKENIQTFPVFDSAKGYIGVVEILDIWRKCNCSEWQSGAAQDKLKGIDVGDCVVNKISFSFLGQDACFKDCLDVWLSPVVKTKLIMVQKDPNDTKTKATAFIVTQGAILKKLMRNEQGREFLKSAVGSIMLNTLQADGVGKEVPKNDHGNFDLRVKTFDFMQYMADKNTNSIPVIDAKSHQMKNVFCAKDFLAHLTNEQCKLTVSGNAFTKGSRPEKPFIEESKMCSGNNVFECFELLDKHDIGRVWLVSNQKRVNRSFSTSDLLCNLPKWANF